MIPMTTTQRNAMNTETDDLIDAIEATAAALGLARAAEQALEDERPLVKSAAIRRLMGTENPETGKPHSASSAEKVVETDAEYMAHRRAQRDAVVATQEAWGRYEAAKQRAALAVQLTPIYFREGQSA